MTIKRRWKEERHRMRALLIAFLCFSLLPSVAFAADWDDEWTGAHMHHGTTPTVIPGGRAFIQMSASDTGLSPMLAIRGLASICLDGRLGASPGTAYSLQISVLMPVLDGDPDLDKAVELGLLQAASPCVHAVPSGPIFLSLKASPTHAATVVVQGY